MESNVVKDKYLSALEIVGNEIALVMDSDRVVYYSSDMKSKDLSVEIKATPAEPGWTCEGDLGTIALKRGVNTFHIKVKNGETLLREYCLSIIQNHITSDTSLKKLLVGEETAEAEHSYNGEIDHYYARVPADATQVEIDAVPSDPDAEVQGDLGLQSLEAGVNTFVITVCSADGKEEARYHLVVQRAEEQGDDAADGIAPIAKDLGPAAQGEVPSFGSLRESFSALLDEIGTANPPQETDEIELAQLLREIDKIEAGASLREPAAPPAGLQSDLPEERPSQVAVEVERAPAQEAMIPPSVEATKPALKGLLAFALLRQAASAEAFLGKVSKTAESDYEAYLESCKEEQTAFLAPIQPAFSPEVYHYDLYLGGDVGGLYISGHTAGDGWEVRGAIGYHKLEGDGAEFALSVHDAATGLSTPYTLTVHIQQTTIAAAVKNTALQEAEVAAAEMRKAQRTNARLSELTLSRGTLSPKFSPSAFAYTVKLKEKMNYIEIAAKTAEDTATVTGDVGEKPLLKGKNVFRVVGVAADGEHRAIYTVTVHSKGQLKTKEKASPKKTSTPPDGADTAKKQEKTKKAPKANSKRVRTESKMVSSLKAQMGKLFPARVRSAARPKMKLRSQLIVMIVVTLAVGYVGTRYLAQPISLENDRLQQVAGETRSLRREVEVRLEGRMETEEKIRSYQGQIQELSKRYPYIPSQEEILNYIEQLRGKASFDYTIVSIGQSVELSTDELMSNMVQKGLWELFQADQAKLTPPTLSLDAPPPETVPTDAENGTVTTVEIPHHFDKNVVVLELRGAKENLLSICQEIYNDGRMLVVDEPILAEQDMEGGDAAKEWGMQVSVLYYHYTGEQTLRDEGLWEIIEP